VCQPWCRAFQGQAEGWFLGPLHPRDVHLRDSAVWWQPCQAYCWAQEVEMARAVRATAPPWTRPALRAWQNCCDLCGPLVVRPGAEGLVSGLWVSKWWSQEPRVCTLIPGVLPLRAPTLSLNPGPAFLVCDGSSHLALVPMLTSVQTGISHPSRTAHGFAQILAYSSLLLTGL
jgi:hypothetical protein